MRPALLLLLALLLSGCYDEPANHATIHNDGTAAAQVHVVFSSSDGTVVREETRNLTSGEGFEFSLDHPRDGTYQLTVETDDGRSAGMTVTWQGSTGPARVRFFIHDDRIEEEQLVY